MNRRLFLGILSIILIPLSISAAPIPRTRIRFSEVKPGTYFKDKDSVTWYKFSGPERPSGSLNAVNQTTTNIRNSFSQKSFSENEVVYI